jgi:hypothetical protein
MQFYSRKFIDKLDYGLMVDFSVTTNENAGQKMFSPSAPVALLLDPGPGMVKSQDPEETSRIRYTGRF